jgi:NTP pyrophosphatase (non-canonical NTP hydrolase)
MEELQEVKDAPTEKERAGELGDLLFAVVNLVSGTGWMPNLS